MLPKVNRLTKKKDFDAVFKGGKTLKYGFLIFKMAANNVSQSRFGFVVSKKISTKATVRNLVKRRLRGAVEKELRPFKTPQDVVILTLSGIQKQDFITIRESIKNFFKYHA